MHEPREQTWAVVLAAGSGSRLDRAGLGVRKQFLQWRGRPLFWQSVKTFGRVVGVRGVVLVFPPGEAEALAEEAAALFQADGVGLDWRAAPGGARRQDSVAAGLAALPPGCTRVLVHDAARPFMSAALIQSLLDALDGGAQAAIPALAVTDTIKRAEDGRIIETLDRSQLVAVQTPQAFTLDLLRKAHQRAGAEGWDVTDDAGMVERLGRTVVLVPGQEDNVKITTPADLERLEHGRSVRTVTGLGVDVHRYALDDDPEARPMVLGGVPIPNAPGVLAHSDGDVLLHALADAVAGCAGLGDIGRHFPDTDPAYANADSAVLAKAILLKAAEAGVRPVHADCTIVAQTPRIAPHADAIRKVVAGLLELEPGRVNVKATTEERLGFTGRKEGIKALVLVTAEAT